MKSSLTRSHKNKQGHEEPRFYRHKSLWGRSQINQAMKRVKMEQIQCLRSFFPGGLRRLLTTSTERIYRHPNSNIPQNYQQSFHEMTIYFNFFIAFLWIQFKCDEFHFFHLKFIFIAFKIPLGRTKRNRREEFNFIKFISHIFAPHFHETIFCSISCLYAAN